MRPFSVATFADIYSLVCTLLFRAFSFRPSPFLLCRLSVDLSPSIICVVLTLGVNLAVSLCKLHLERDRV